jgi:hypothetical protein
VGTVPFCGHYYPTPPTQRRTGCPPSSYTRGSFVKAALRLAGVSHINSPREAQSLPGTDEDGIGELGKAHTLVHSLWLWLNHGHPHFVSFQAAPPPFVAKAPGKWREKYASVCEECFEARVHCLHHPERRLRLLFIGTCISCYTSPAVFYVPVLLLFCIPLEYGLGRVPVPRVTESLLSTPPESCTTTTSLSASELDASLRGYLFKGVWSPSVPLSQTVVACGGVLPSRTQPI